MSTDDQFATYDLSFWITMSTPNIVQNAEMISAFLCSDSSVADGVIRSSMYDGLCVCPAVLEVVCCLFLKG